MIIWRVSGSTGARSSVRTIAPPGTACPERGRRLASDRLELAGQLGAREKRPHGIERGRLPERDQHALLLHLELEDGGEHPRQGRDHGLGERAVASRGVDVHGQETGGREPRPRRREELGGEAVKGRVGAAGEDVDLDDVEELASPPQERPSVLDVDLEVGPPLEAQVLVGDPHDEGVDLDRGDVRSGIEAPVGRGGRPAAHPQDQHPPAPGEERPEVEDVVVAAGEQAVAEPDRMGALAGVVQDEQPVPALVRDEDACCRATPRRRRCRGEAADRAPGREGPPG